MPEKLKIGLISLYALENNGIRYVASSLREAGFEVIEIYFKDWKNNSFPWPTEPEILTLISTIEKLNINFVGFSVRASAFHRIASNLTRRIRQSLHLPILWGGMHPTFLPEKCIEQADFIAIGEVEHHVVEFFQRYQDGKDINTTPSFWIRKANNIYRNDIGPLENNLDLLPFRDFSSKNKYYIEGTKVISGDPYIKNPEYNLLASRGCPYWTCTYCSNTVTKPLYHGLGHDYRIRSVENIVQELEYALKLNPGMKVVRFDDEVFPVKSDWIDEFHEKWPSRVGIPFEILVDPRMVDEQPLKKLKEAGLRALCMGVQATERVNHELYHRFTTNQQIFDAQRIFAKLGIKSSLQVIWDDPASTEKDKDDLFKLLMSLDRPFELYLFGLTIYPNTHLARRLEREGRITPEQIEGEGVHAFKQFRVDLSYPRPPEDKRWLALMVMLNKPFIPLDMVWYLYSKGRFKKNPESLVLMAQTANIINMGLVVSKMALKGEVSLLLIKRWLNLDSFITM